MKILFIGGSGMLKNAVSFFAENKGAEVYLLCRKNPQMDGVHFLACDYHEKREFIQIIKNLKDIDKIVVWMHTSAMDSFHELYIHAKESEIHIFHLKGSAFYHPNTKYSCTQYLAYENYKSIMLGFNINMETQQSSWLSNEQICDGVIQAIQQNKDIQIGNIAPWSAIP